MQKRHNKEFNIFSMSILDLFASAMGAFLIIMLILIPYYLNAGDAEKLVVKLRAENAKLTQQLKQQQERTIQCERQLARLQGELEDCHEKLAHTFLAVALKWATPKHDVDLHVVDTDRNEFYYDKHNRTRSDFPSSNAELSVDTTRGPGIEIWENPRAKTGIYRIYVNLYSQHGNTANPLVKTNLYYRDGALPLRDVTLTRVGNKVLIAIVEVKRGGEVVVRH
jgi:cell division protein FtsB